jgi:alpha-beta hydrolase superfamily lysophospholipase
MKPTSHQIKFTVQDLILTGVLHLPRTTGSPPLVVGSHGLEGSKNSAKQQALSVLLPENGMAFFRFDHRGCGTSQGDFLTQTSLETRTQDYVAAVTHVLGLGLTGQSVALFGSSMGGATCINAWKPLEDQGISICAGVICSAPVVSATIHKVPPTATGRNLPLRFFVENLIFNLLDRARDLHHLLIFHGDADDVVPVENAHNLYHRARSPKKIVIFPKGDHQASSTAHQAAFEKETLAWLLQAFG